MCSRISTGSTTDMFILENESVVMFSSKMKNVRWTSVFIAFIIMNAVAILYYNSLVHKYTYELNYNAYL